MSTPHRRSASARVPCTSLHYEHDNRYCLAQFENTGKYVEMGPESFLEVFLPVIGDIPAYQGFKSAENALKRASGCQYEVDMYSDLVQAFQAYCPTLEFHDTHMHPAYAPYGEGKVEIKPDISSYYRGGVGPEEPTISEADPPELPGEDGSEESDISEEAGSEESDLSEEAGSDEPDISEVAGSEEPDSGSEESDGTEEAGAEEQVSAEARPEPARPHPAEKLAPVNLQEAEIIVEVKLRLGDDAFSDETEGQFEMNTTQGQDTRGQITMYATAQLALQQRTHCFSILVIGTFARLIRWDRAGAVVTPRFDYTRTSWLQKFLHSYSYATPKVRGIDTSVYSLDDCDDESVRTSEQATRNALNLLHEPLYVFEIYDDTTGNLTRVIGSQPCVRNTDSLTGRCTRCYKVYDPKDREVRFLKDTWKVSAQHILGEAVVYSKLKAAGVRNILTLLTSGNVRHRGPEDIQATQTHRRQTKGKPPLKRLRGHYHCRLLFKECGESLLNCKSVGQLITVMHDSMIAHKDAYEKAKILHRDISSGNIIMVDGKGILIDWDVAKLHTDRTPRQNERTGTWQFISAKLLLAKKPTLHVLADDLESYFHVLSLQVLKYTKHGMPLYDLANYIKKVYEEVSVVGEGSADSHRPPQGGHSKSWSLVVRSMTLLPVPNDVLHSLLDDLEDVLRVRYLPKPRDADKKGLRDIERLEQELATAQGERRKILRQTHAAWQAAREYTEYTKRLEDHNLVLGLFDRATSLEHRMPEKLKLNKTKQLAVDTLYAKTRKRKNDDVSDSEDEREHWNKKSKKPKKKV
ncbi:hypothetical protein E1B28_007445 [Marasmius oreades]|uniref:Fungal-type protein kinase domain-containing protein n=1 Tax=Marasmius oreades TaxID=181124 RepID=A0A9P7S279_9AGAR|nr:uncharacterized protein E1B28_007445 [Marasmius oreades]KAG7093803.1 hypothetical protein E1B28_007445 [Marasmius oreades]